jgi:aldehyde dehydrogenase
LGGEFEGGYYFEPTVLKGHNKMRVFQEEIFGPVLAVTTFADEEEALAIANDTLYGLGAGVWTRNGNLAYRMGRGIKAGRVWTNCFHLYPAGAAFGGYKISGVGRENHQGGGDAGGPRGHRTPGGRTRAAHVLPVGWLL